MSTESIYVSVATKLQERMVPGTPASEYTPPMINHALKSEVSITLHL